MIFWLTKSSSNEHINFLTDKCSQLFDFPSLFFINTAAGKTLRQEPSTRTCTVHCALRVRDMHTTMYSA